jgi:hypothetical protein
VTLDLFRAMLLTEGRLRLRRGSTQVVLVVFILAAWFMVVDPSTGYAMLAANSARVAYTSTALAFGSSVVATTLLGLFGFYLVRGRVDEDLRSGIGSVLAATPMSNASLVLGRWAGGVAYLGALILVLAGAMLVLQLVRGEGAIQPFVYLHFYLLAILPNIFFIVGMAVLCESYQPLRGKAGDLLYFFFWLVQIALGAMFVAAHPDRVAPLALDVTGMGVLCQRGQQVLHTGAMSVGLNAFDKSLPAVLMAGDFWTWPMALTRLAAALLSVIPLAIAARLFHRFSPDQVKVSSRKTWAVGERVNRILRPLDVFSGVLLRFSRRLPGLPGQVIAELALTFATMPLAGPLLVLFVIAGAALDAALLPWLLMAAVLFWGVAISDLSVRDFKADTEHMGSAARGGGALRYWRQCVATMLLGLLLTAPVMARWAMAEPLRALCLASGLVALTGLAQLLGRTTRTGRAFTVLFLFGLYLSSQGQQIAALDVVGAYGKATVATITQQFVAGIACLAAGFAYHRRRGLR